jgi:RHS repeat-associated protein
MTTIGSNTPTYDANGNVTNDFLNTYAWDSNARPVTVNGVGITYDALGREAELANGSTYTEIQYSPTGFKMQLLNGSTLVKGFVPMPGGTAEVWTGGGANYYRHSDWLGSSRLASNFSRTIYYDGAYGPFGEQYANTGTTDLSFTGMNQDTASNVYDFPAREYGIQGRWPSPDPAGISATQIEDPQTWNRYAYVRNSPLNMTDPTGLCSHLETRSDETVTSGCYTGYPGGGGSGGDGSEASAELAYEAEFGLQDDEGTDPWSSPTDPNSNPCGTCFYLNASGTGLDDQPGPSGNINGTDHNSNANECQQNGGYFFAGWANPATLSIDPDGGQDPTTQSAVTANGMYQGSLYNMTMSSPGQQYGALNAPPSQLFTPQQCNQLNQGLTLLNWLGGIGIGAGSYPLSAGLAFGVGAASATAGTLSQQQLSQELCGGPSLFP